MRLTDHTLRSALDALNAGETTSVALTEAFLEGIARLNPRLNAFITVSADQALEAAKASDARRAVGKAGPLEGAPLAIKDLFCTAGTQTTAGSAILGGFVPPYESTVTKNLLRDGAVFLGKVNLDEFAMGSSNKTSAYGAVENPWSRANDPDTRLVPGGSSGGSAAAVAAHLALGATATDTGGSIRQPAAFCGIAGIKPTYGRCSRFGIVAFASSLDQAGPVARTVEDCAILLRSMAGFDPRDATSADLPVPDFAAACARPVKGLRIGVPREYRLDGMAPEIEALWRQGLDWLVQQGATLVDISLPHTKYALPTYYVVAPAEASSNLARYDGVRFGLRETAQNSDLRDLYERTRAKGFGAEVQRRIMIGTYVLSAGYYDAYYLKAQKVRALIRRDFEQAWGQVDAIVTPATPSAAFGMDEKQDDPVTMYLNDVFTVTANLAGLPGIAVPAGLDAQGLPLGLQVIGKPWDEETCFSVGAAIERAANFTAVPGIRA
ncbi:Asp-tRNA(Asn)/Glu-tRNA(Gln) amidotransferase GatCAB subunit A [Falsiroseomonas bella]|uniref:Glutamyl-tRNA(Gln) amidotransferase subunit A n=1 Tax=Falsiroseomonas bella TaxID=2184016 RepID=A0A317FBL5_9PROT|nr:Asp-tRNA(Asn)/Glu-tRNA(Gln) amidotransferase subunit GatA [Falsiroseomonas bella]PWS36491.1 Asp-tRNA(Asn)/Glu-tRNA(Gln) amidotransferase GatCAB subunit A [Falsiroseomonas bella]